MHGQKKFKLKLQKEKYENSSVYSNEQVYVVLVVHYSLRYDRFYVGNSCRFVERDFTENRRAIKVYEQTIWMKWIKKDKRR